MAAAKSANLISFKINKAPSRNSLLGAFAVQKRNLSLVTWDNGCPLWAGNTEFRIQLRNQWLGLFELCARNDINARPRCLLRVVVTCDDGVRMTFLWQVGARQIHRRSEEHTSELQSRGQLVCRLLLEKKQKRMY